MEDAFCKDFLCCGREIADLHELLQHFEDHLSTADADDEDDRIYPGLYESNDEYGKMVEKELDRMQQSVDSCYMPLTVTDMTRLWKPSWEGEDATTPPISPGLSSGESSSTSSQSSSALRPQSTSTSHYIFYGDDIQRSLELADQESGWILKAATDTMMQCSELEGKWFFFHSLDCI